MTRYAGYNVFNKESEEVLKELNDALQNNTVIEGEIKSANNGGFVFDFKGYPCFLPMSETTHKFEPEVDLINFLNTFQKVKVKDIRNKTVIVSRRMYLKDIYDKLELEKLSQIKPGDKFRGVVHNSDSFGVFILKEYSLGLLRVENILDIEFKSLEPSNKKLLGIVLKRVFIKKLLVNAIVNRVTDGKFSLMLDESKADSKLYIAKIKNIIETDPEFLPLKQELESI